MRLLRRPVLASLLLLSAACGSTVPPTTTTSQQGLGPAAADATGNSPLSSGQGASRADGGVSDAGTSGSNGSSSSSSGAAGIPSSATTTGPGNRFGTSGAVAARAGAPVEVGFEYATGVTEFAQALGISADVGDGSQQAKAIAAWVNSHGGLAGHPIKPVFYDLDLTRTDPYAKFMAEMCTMWTEDHHVVAAFAYANADFSPVAHCLTQHHAVFSSYSAYSRDQRDFTSNRNWVETSTLRSERLADLQVRGLEQQGFFKGQTKVGLLAYDYEAASRLTDGLVSKLKSRGIETVVYKVTYGGSTPALSGTISSIQSAVLRFRSQNIQRVMSAAYPGAIGFFMRYADSQSYQPLYGLSSYDGLGSLPANAPTRQLHGAVAVGWWPTADLAAADRPGLNGAGRICRAAFSKAGIPASQDAYSFGYCDEVLSLQAASRLLGGQALTGDALVGGLERLGSSYTSPSMLATVFTQAQRDGIARSQPLAFNDTCTCWRVRGGSTPIP